MPSPDSHFFSGLPRACSAIVFFEVRLKRVDERLHRRGVVFPIEPRRLARRELLDERVGRPERRRERSDGECDEQQRPMALAHGARF
jgi:hypothetical protein